MGFVVEAWFYHSARETIAKILRSSLATGGFVPVNMPAARRTPWDDVALHQHQVFFALTPMSENHLAATVKSKIDGDEGYSAFEHIFIYLLNHCQNTQLVELLLSTRNSQPYPFLTHSFHQGSFPPTIVDLNKAHRIISLGQESYWAKWGPELHFIANEVFERTQVDVVTFAQSLSAGIISVQGGVVLDCGWTKEFALPKQLSSSNNLFGSN